MNREQLSNIISGLDDRRIAEAIRYAPEEAYVSSERMLYMKKKRLITLALAAALILALGITSYAVTGGARSTGTHIMKDTGEYTDLADLPKVEEIAGYKICLPEKFSNGFAFSKLYLGGEAVYDENYLPLKEYYSVMSTYVSGEGRVLYLDVSPVPDLPDIPEPPAPSSGCFIGETEVRISKDHYKFVPADYEKTEADLAAEEAGHYYISFGADEIEEYDMIFADFDLENVRYVLMDMGDQEPALSEQAIIQMASELISFAK